MSELTRRILFAVVAAPATVAIVYFGGWVLAAALGALAALGAWELFRMARAGGIDPMEPPESRSRRLIPLAGPRAATSACTRCRSRRRRRDFPRVACEP